MSTPNGRYILMDIGSETLKALEVSVKGSYITVLNSLVMPDVDKYLTEYGVENMSGLVEALIENIKDNKMYAKSVMITSSVLGIKSKLVIDKPLSEKEDNPDANNLLKIVSEQYYGSEAVADGVANYSVVSSATINTLKSFVNELLNNGYNVISIEPHETNTFDLIKLIESSFDYPGKVIIDFGKTVKIYGSLNDKPVFIRPYEVSFIYEMERLAGMFNITFEEMRDIFVSIGLTTNDKNHEYLVAKGIDPLLYLSHAGKACTDYLKALKEVVDTEITGAKLGRCYLILTGGLADIPGIYDYILYAFDDPTTTVIKAHIEKLYETDYVNIANKANSAAAVTKRHKAKKKKSKKNNKVDSSFEIVYEEDALQAENSSKEVGCLFGGCIALLFRGFYKAPMNLLPSKFLEKRPDLSVSIFSKVSITVACLAVAATTVLFYYQFSNFMVTPGYGNRQEASLQLSMVQSYEKKLKSQLSGIQNIDLTAQKIVAFCNSYKDSQSITFMSVDSMDILPTVQDKEAAGKVTVTSSKGSDPASTGTKTILVKEPKTYVIRGLSRTPESVTKFYASLVEENIADAVYIYSVEKTTLPSTEEIYVYEIRVDGPAIEQLKEVPIGTVEKETVAQKEETETGGEK